jgi:hypothetical protein
MSLNKTVSIAKKIFAAVTEVFMVLHFSKKLVYSKNLADEFASITSSITVVSSILGMSRSLRNIARINYLLNFTGNHYDKKKLHIINDYHRSLLGSEFLLGISGVCSLISILFLNNIFKTANVAALTISGCFYIEQINLYSIISKKEFNLCSL